MTNIELHDAVLTYIQTTGSDITEETKKIADVSDDAVERCKRFYEMHIKES